MSMVTLLCDPRFWSQRSKCINFGQFLKRFLFHKLHAMNMSTGDMYKAKASGYGACFIWGTSGAIMGSLGSKT